jgi:hypothetical protein
VQTSPQAAVQWQALRLSGQEALAVRASKKLRNDELLVTTFAGTSLRRELDRIPLWRGNYVAIKQLAEDFARYVYLPRLAEPAVLFCARRCDLGFPAKVDSRNLFFLRPGRVSKSHGFVHCD